MFSFSPFVVRCFVVSPLSPLACTRANSFYCPLATSLPKQDMHVWHHRPQTRADLAPSKPSSEEPKTNTTLELSQQAPPPKASQLPVQAFRRSQRASDVLPPVTAPPNPSQSLQNPFHPISTNPNQPTRTSARQGGPIQLSRRHGFAAVLLACVRGCVGKTYTSESVIE